MNSVRHPRHDWPLKRLAAHAEAYAGDTEMLQAIHAAVVNRGTPESDALAQHVLGLIARQAATPEDPQEIEARLAAAEAEVHAVKQRLLEAEERRVQAEAHEHHADRQARLWDKPPPASQNARYGRVHLLPTAPEWILVAARRAFRIRYHPDRFSDPKVRENAEVLFKDTEAVFAELRTPRLGGTRR